jgi:hypothetical protein
MRVSFVVVFKTSFFGKWKSFFINSHSFGSISKGCLASKRKIPGGAGREIQASKGLGRRFSALILPSQRQDNKNRPMGQKMAF